MNECDFIPCTRAVRVRGTDVVYRPIKSWHSGTFAGEGKLEANGDRSGCIIRQVDGMALTSPPRTVVHRVYWNGADGWRKRSVSAFLSYPNAMGAVPDYFWEANVPSDDDSIRRFTGDRAEQEMERVIVAYLQQREH